MGRLKDGSPCSRTPVVRLGALGSGIMVQGKPRHVLVSCGPHSPNQQAQGARMADVSIYVAVISASAAILGAAVTPLTTVVQAGRQARRGRREQLKDAVRQECVELIRAGWDLRTITLNNHEYQGQGTREGLARLRERAADAAVCSATIAMLEPGSLGKAAADLAAAAQRLSAAAENTQSIRDPDFTELEARMAKFGEATAVYFGA